MGFFSFLNQQNEDVQIKEYLTKGAIVLDVRTDEEWHDAHLEGAKHIVLTDIPNQIEQIKSWNKPIIAVCKSGGRSEQATNFLTRNGLDVINGGPWQNVASVVSRK